MTIGDKAPEILGKDEQGREIRLSDYKGRLITRRFFDPLKMAESITDLRIYGFTEIKPE